MKRLLLLLMAKLRATTSCFISCVCCITILPFIIFAFRWYEYKTEVLSCQKNRLVPASVWHRKDLTEKIDNLKAGGTSEFK